MPTYEYKCMSCGKVFEYFQRITDEPKSICEECGGEIKRLISGGLSPIFKGTGFYQTDYKSNSNNETKTKPKSESQKSETANSKESSTSTKKK